MKKHLLLFLALLCVGLTSGCDDDAEQAPDSVYLYTTSASVGSGAGTHSVTVFTTCAWEASADGWISVEPLSAGEKGIYAVHLGYGENTTGAARTGSVVFRAGDYMQTFTMTQKSN